jgi:processive 1,2-diacylglycerol beta-glucosyltransferase
MISPGLGVHHGQSCADPARIAIVSASVAAGHDGVARELAARLGAAGSAVDCHDFVQLVPGGKRFRAAYRQQLAIAPNSWGWLLRTLQRWRVLSSFVGLLASSSRRRLLGALHPDTAVVISTYPLATQALARLKRQGKLSARLVVYLTDPSVHRLAVADGVDLYIANHSVTAREALEMGATGVAVTASAVPARFRPAISAAETLAARTAFGLPAHGYFVLVLSGSWGVGEVEATAHDVLSSGAGVPVVVCGQNDALRDRLRRTMPEAVVLGWVDDMPLLMRACSIVVQNAGGLSVQEARASGLPVLTYRSIPGHGETNAVAYDKAEVAEWVRDPGDLKRALIEPAYVPDGQCAGPDPALVIGAMAPVSVA